MATKRIFTLEEQSALEAFAQRRGFSEIRAYVRALVEADLQQHGDPLSLTGETEDALDDPVESFRRGWGEAMRGETLTEDEFWKAVNEGA